MTPYLPAAAVTGEIQDILDKYSLGFIGGWTPGRWDQDLSYLKAAKGIVITKATGSIKKEEE